MVRQHRVQPVEGGPFQIFFRLCYTESPIIEDLTLQFEQDQVTLNQKPNLSVLHWKAKPRLELVGVAG